MVQMETQSAGGTRAHPHQEFYLILYPKELEDEIIQTLEAVHVPGYTELPKMVGRGRHIRHFDAGQGDRRSPAGHGAADLSAVALNAAHTGRERSGKDSNILIAFDTAGPHRTSDHRAGTANREGPVDRHSKHVIRRAVWHLASERRHLTQWTSILGSASASP